MKFRCDGILPSREVYGKGFNLNQSVDYKTKRGRFKVDLNDFNIATINIFFRLRYTLNSFLLSISLTYSSTYVLLLSILANFA